MEPRAGEYPEAFTEPHLIDFTHYWKHTMCNPHNLSVGIVVVCVWRVGSLHLPRIVSLFYVF